MCRAVVLRIQKWRVTAELGVVAKVVTPVQAGIGRAVD